MSKSTPRLRVAAAKAPKTPASRRARRTAAAQKEQAESATNRASVYTALRKKAVGKKAKVATRETSTPHRAGLPPQPAPRRTSSGKRGKKAVLSGFWSS